MNVKYINTQIYYKCFLIKCDGSIDNAFNNEYRKSMGKLSINAQRKHRDTISKTEQIDFKKLLIEINKKFKEFYIDLGIEFKVKTIEVGSVIEDDSVVTVTYNLNEKHNYALIDSDFMVFDVIDHLNIGKRIEERISNIIRYFKCNKYQIRKINTELENSHHLYLSSDSTSKLLHEIFSHSFEDDFYQLNQNFKGIKSFFRDGINVIDNYSLKYTYDDLGTKIHSNIELISNGRFTGNLLNRQTGNLYIDMFSSEKNELVRTTNTFFEIINYKSDNELIYPYIEIEHINYGTYNYKESIITLVISRAYYHEGNSKKKALEPFQFSIKINEISKSTISRIGEYENVSTLCMKLSNVRHIKNYVSKTFLENVPIIYWSE